jgi:hypothetical protein
MKQYGNNDDNDDGTEAERGSPSMRDDFARARAGQVIDSLVCVRIIHHWPAKHGHPARMRGQVLPQLLPPDVHELVCVGDFLNFRRVHVAQIPMCLNSPEFRERWKPRCWTPRNHIFAPRGERLAVYKSEDGMPIRTVSTTNVSNFGGQFLDAVRVRAAVAPGDVVRVMLSLPYTNYQGDNIKHANGTGPRYVTILAVDTVNSEWLYCEAHNNDIMDYCGHFPPGAVARVSRADISEVMYSRCLDEFPPLGGGVSVTGCTLRDPVDDFCHPPDGGDAWFEPTEWPLL